MKQTIIYLCLAIVLISCSSKLEAELKPFTSDGCSSFPDGNLKQNTLWLSCCVEHDKSYWMGGLKQQRLEADLALRSCVAQTGEKVISQLMLTGVRVGGSPYWPTKFRWGYGWHYGRGYQALDENELIRAKNLLETYEKQLAESN